jgi:oligopeptide transport system substrate-binding protein
MNRFALLFCLVLSLAGCGNGGNDRPVSVSVIGPQPVLADPNSGVLSAPSQTLGHATMQGLVVVNPAGEVVPGLAESWIVTDDGLSYIFRIRHAQWGDGRIVTAEDVARSLKASLGPMSRNPLKAHFYAVTDIVALTERVLEIRYKMPQANVLQMLARPEMSVMRKGRGVGPMMIQKPGPGEITLRPVLLKDQVEEVGAAEIEKYTLFLRGEPAAKAIARFAAKNVSLVLGGRFTELPLLEVSRFPEDAVLRDPVFGLFGLVASTNSRVLAEPYARRALAMAIDRAALMSHFRLLGWQGQEALLPVSVEGLGEQPRPDWLSFDQNARVSRARSIIKGFTSSTAPLILSIALPTGPGARVLFAQLKADWALIGVDLRRDTKGAPDLQLIDSVAAFNNVGWYFAQLACGQGFHCSADADAAVKDARTAATTEDRNVALIRANRALVADQVFIPIAQPLRWSLVGADVSGFKENQVGVHPIRWLRRIKP